MYRSNEEALGMWTNYFTSLYGNGANIKLDHIYDAQHENMINLAVENLKSTVFYEDDPILNGGIDSGEVLREIQLLKLGKKGGYDGLTNEHLKYGGNELASCLSHLFNAMYTLGFVPSDMKRGLIYTLYKGSRKYDDDRKNYRGISLLPVVTKLFEKLILNRMKAWLSQNDITFPSSNQNA